MWIFSLRRRCRARRSDARRGAAEDGRVQQRARPGNARGNALSTNAPPPRAWPITEYTWFDEGAAATVRVPLAPLSVGTTASKEPAALRVHASFAARSFDLEVTDVSGRLHHLRFAELPGALDPQARSVLWPRLFVRSPDAGSKCAAGLPPPRRRRRRGRRYGCAHAQQSASASGMDHARRGRAAAKAPRHHGVCLVGRLFAQTGLREMRHTRARLLLRLPDKRTSCC